MSWYITLTFLLSYLRDDSFWCPLPFLSGNWIVSSYTTLFCSILLITLQIFFLICWAEIKSDPWPKWIIVQIHLYTFRYEKSNEILPLLTLSNSSMIRCLSHKSCNICKRVSQGTSVYLVKSVKWTTNVLRKLKYKPFKTL